MDSQLKALVSILAYMGAKFHLAHIYAAAMVYEDADRYHDVFAGAANLLLQKPPHKIEIYNDIDSDLCSIMRQLSTEQGRNELLKRMFEFPYTEEMFIKAGKVISNGYKYAVEINHMSDCEYASYAWYKFLTSKNGNKEGSFRGFSKNMNEDKFYNQIYGKLEILERMEGVQVTNRSALDIIREETTKQSLSARTMYFFDSPYLNNKARYPHDMSSQSEHEEYCEMVGQLGGYKMVCGYDNEDYRKVYDKILVGEYGFHKYFIAEVAKTMAIGGGGQMKPRENECIWTSYQLKGAYEL